jgi:1-acyl-sn-glycerol-3-phosphate acyltransferase
MRKILLFTAKIAGKIIFRVLFSLEVKGYENIPEKGGFIIAANHASFLDAIILGVISPREVNFFAKGTLFKKFFTRNIVKNFGAVPVRRDNSTISMTLRKGVRIIKEGKGVVIFPEGTRSLNGYLQKGKPGIGFLAVKSGAPVIPVRIKGSYEALRRGAKFIKINKIKVIIGKRLTFKEKNYQEISKKVMLHIKNM